MVIVADSSGAELRVLNYTEYDFDINEQTADFEVSIAVPDWVEIPEDSRIYIPDTEYGGIYKRLSTDTKLQSITVGGFTWRGLMRNKIIQPPAGEDYARDAGDIGTIINNRVTEAFGGLFTGASPAGVYANYQYPRYCTLYDGLTRILASVGYMMRIKYSQTLKKVVVDAVPITDYSERLEFSSDMSADYYVSKNRDNVNHLICLGSGELAERTVIHLYTDEQGNISQTQTFFRADEIAETFEYTGAESDQLLQSGIERLKSLQKTNEFSLEFEGDDLEIGDIVGGKDYITGITMRAKVVGKLHQSVGGHETTEYKISDNVEVDK